MSEIQTDACDCPPPETAFCNACPDPTLTFADAVADNSVDQIQPRIRSTRRFFREWAEWLTALSTFALVIYTAILAHYAYNQTDLLNKQLVRIDRSLTQTDILITDANSQEKSSQTQAEQAIKSNTQNYRNSVTQLRPYISVGHFVFAKNSDVFPSNIEIKNAGQTPALNTVFRTRMIIASLGAIQKVLGSGLDNATPLPNEDTTQLIGGGDTINAILNRDRLTEEGQFFKDTKDFSDAEIADYKARQKFLWVSGVAFYDDVFEERSRIRFCYIINGVTRAINRCQSNNDLAFFNKPR